MIITLSDDDRKQVRVLIITKSTYTFHISNLFP